MKWTYKAIKTVEKKTFQLNSRKRLDYLKCFSIVLPNCFLLKRQDNINIIFILMKTFTFLKINLLQWWIEEADVQSNYRSLEIALIKPIKIRNESQPKWSKVLCICNK